jgi:hypothetical protein
VIGSGARTIAATIVALILAAWGLAARQQGAPFPHAAHAKVFISCATCHAGVLQPNGDPFPDPSACASCHDGTTEKRVAWQPRIGPRVSNLRFDHRLHATRRAERSDSSPCSDCHADRGAGWMQVRAPEAPQCVTCHTGGRGTHLTQPDTACATCHLPLAAAVTLPVARVARFPVPPSHQAPGFLSSAGHGAAARHTVGAARVAQSCATCHAREFCAACHVNAPELPVIQALALDKRSLVLPHALKTPPSHAALDFESRHGALAGRTAASCQTCHTQESCLTCHRAEAPAAVAALYHAGPGRAAGAQTTPRMPASHGVDWKIRHGPVASAAIRTCTSCHARVECLTCHQPDPSRRGSYHPAAYLTRHPADAYSRSSSCNDCHNTGEFCQTCHKQGGLTARRTLLGAGGYHDGNRQFFLGHGQAARQALETCVSCHVERDCLTCHSVVRGRSFNPHGPGFDPERMLRKNPQLCTACHGTSIPRRRTAP